MAGWGRCRRCGGPIYWGVSPYDESKAFPFNDDEEEQPHFDTCSAQEWVVDEYGERHSVSHCRACNANVWWDTTWRGRRRPMDVDGSTATGECHFDTCPGERVREEQQARAQPTQEQAERSRRTREEQDYARRQRVNVEGAPFEFRLWLPDLELSWPCTRADVTAAFRRLALVHHPDMGGQATEFIRIKNAYDRLKQLLEGVRV